jgi:hypothetical protein
MLSRSILVVAMAAVLSGAAEARSRPNYPRQPGSPIGGQPGAQANQPLRLQGVIENVGSGGLVMTDGKTNRQWRVVVPTAASVRITGTAEPDALRSGLYVELEAKVNNKAIVGEVKHLTITTLSSDHPAGIFTDDAKSGDADRPNPGKENKHKPDGERDKAAKQHAGSRVVGRLLVNRSGQFFVEVGRKKLRFELADEPTVQVDASDRSMMRPGDKISVQGVAMPMRQAVVLQAQKVEVKMAEPLGGKRNETKKAGKKSADGESRHPKKDAPPFDPDAK